MLSIRFLFAALFILASSANAHSTREMVHDELTGHISSTYEEVMSTRKLRKEQFGEKLDGFKQQLEKHNSGELLLNEHDYNRVNKKIKMYTHKLNELDLDKDPRVSP